MKANKVKAVRNTETATVATKAKPPRKIVATVPLPEEIRAARKESLPTCERTTQLSKADLEEFRKMLLEKRAELVGDMNHLQNEALRQGSSGENTGASFMPIHMADLGSDTWEQELTLGLIENERSLLREIDDALARIEDNTYGICLATGKPISKSRLRAKPWAKYCIEHARKIELGLV